MSGLWLPLLFALFLWWFSTGLVLLADRRLPGGGLALSSLGAVAAVAALALVADRPDVTGAYVGFTAGLALWGWHEVSFLSGALTGPRSEPCPASARGWTRFRLATGTLIHHELAIAATALALAALLHGAANAVALWTFLLLWAMRLSAKLNLFLGVPNLTRELLPARLGYLFSYCPQRPINPLFPLSATLGTAVTLGLGHAAWTAAPGFAESSLALLAGLAALGVLEHWFLVLPIRDAALWRWCLGQGRTTSPERRDETKTKPATADEPLATSGLGAAAIEGRRS